MKPITKFVSPYLTDYPKVLTYMWQSTDYKADSFIKWWMRQDDFRHTQKRGELVRTTASKAVRAMIGVVALTYLLLNALTIWYLRTNIFVQVVFVSLTLLTYPVIVALLTTIPISILHSFWLVPKEVKRVKRATKIFTNHPGTIIAVAGSYGKTTMKELLAQVLGSSKKVGFTEGNKNTILSIAHFASTLKGDEDIVVVEFGEGASGDISKMTGMVQPDYAVVTGLAPNHLDGYTGLDDIAHDFTSLLVKVGQDKAFINGDSSELFTRLSIFARSYTKDGCLDRWPTKQKLEVNHTSFTLEGCDESINITSGLIGEHNIAVLGFVAAFSRQLGCSVNDVEMAISKTKPYEHRLEPRAFHGAWLIDDTYNGSIEGMKAGLALLKKLKTKGRKIYVTPGLVDQGFETEAVHTELGKAIAMSQPDMLYLMQNSVRAVIEASALKAGFKGEIKVIDEPLQFYQHLENIVAKDDIVMCQNDWPDNYN